MLAFGNHGSGSTALSTVRAFDLRREPWQGFDEPREIVNNAPEAVVDVALMVTVPDYENERVLIVQSDWSVLAFYPEDSRLELLPTVKPEQFASIGPRRMFKAAMVQDTHGSDKLVVIGGRTFDVLRNPSEPLVMALDMKTLQWQEGVQSAASDDSGPTPRFMAACAPLDAYRLAVLGGATGESRRLTDAYELKLA